MAATQSSISGARKNKANAACAHSRQKEAGSAKGCNATPLLWTSVLLLRGNDRPKANIKTDTAASATSKKNSDPLQLDNGPTAARLCFTATLKAQDGTKTQPLTA